MAFDKMKGFFAEWVPKIDKELYSFLEEKVAVQEDPFNKRVVEDIYRFAKAGGKRVRPTLVVAGYLGAGGEEVSKAVKASIAYELLHVYLLIHDDVMDRDELRRGQPTVWKSFMDHYVNGPVSRHEAEALAMLAGDLAETYATEALIRAGFDAETAVWAVKEIHEIAERTGYGQVLDMSLEIQPIENVREEDVMRVYLLKTAKYSVEGPLRLGAKLAGAEEDILKAYRDFAIPVGIVYQIQDDIIGVFGDEKKTGKPVGSDIREGKRTLLIVKAYENATESQRKIIRAVLGRESATPEEIDMVKEIIVETGSLDYSREMMERLVREGIDAIQKSKVRDDIKEFLTEMAEYFVKREK